MSPFKCVPIIHHQINLTSIESIHAQTRIQPVNCIKLRTAASMLYLNLKEEVRAVELLDEKSHGNLFPLWKVVDSSSPLIIPQPSIHPSIHYTRIHTVSVIILYPIISLGIAC